MTEEPRRNHGLKRETAEPLTLLPSLAIIIFSVSIRLAILDTLCGGIMLMCPSVTGLFHQCGSNDKNSFFFFKTEKYSFICRYHIFFMSIHLPFMEA